MTQKRKRRDRRAYQAECERRQAKRDAVFLAGLHVDPLDEMLTRAVAMLDAEAAAKGGDRG